MADTLLETYVTSKGQVVIPSSVRRKFGIIEGTRLRIELDEVHHRIVLIPITRGYIHSIRGKYKGNHLLAALAAEKALEKEK